MSDFTEGEWAVARAAIKEVAFQRGYEAGTAAMHAHCVADETRALRARLVEVERERDEARANYQFMVNRVADEKLDGYRELGARAAAAENRADALQRERDALREALKKIHEHAGSHTVSQDDPARSYYGWGYVFDLADAALSEK